jgi:arylmalonate decarboxylase
MICSRRRFLQAGSGVFIAAGQDRSRAPILGLILPAAASVPPEAITMYPSGVRFITESLSRPGDPPLVGTLATYEKLQERIVPAGKALKGRGADAILLLATSVTFYKGAAHNQRVIDSIRLVSQLPATTMSSAVVDGLRAVRARRLAVAAGYTEDVNAQFRTFLEQSGFEVLAIKGLGLVAPPDNLSRAELETFAFDVFRSSRQADAVVLAFASSRTLELIAPLEKRCNVPVVSARPHAFWAGVRLLGLRGTVQGFGTVLAMG